MAEIKPLYDLDTNLLKALIHGYSSHEKYAVSREDADGLITFKLELVKLDAPYVKPFELEPPDTYERIIRAGYSLAAHDNHQIVGIALCEPQSWNQSMLIHEFHILGTYQGRGIGRALMEVAVNQAKEAGLRIVACETQNTNVPAIRFYQSMGFQIEALDLSLYTNQDWPDGEIALWMKHKIA